MKKLIYFLAAMILALSCSWKITSLQNQITQLDMKLTYSIERLSNPFSPVISQVKEAVVLIKTPEWQGSGVYIGNGLFLTAGHIVENQTDFTLIFENGTTVYATESEKLPNADVAVIYCEEEISCPSIPLAMTNPIVGETVVHIGNVYGEELSYSASAGIVSNLSRHFMNDDNQYIQVNLTAAPGCSGGPVVNLDGQIVGIVIGGWEGLDQVICVPVNIIDLALYLFDTIDLGEVECL